MIHYLLVPHLIIHILFHFTLYYFIIPVINFVVYNLEYLSLHFNEYFAIVIIEPFYHILPKKYF